MTYFISPEYEKSEPVHAAARTEAVDEPHDRSPEALQDLLKEMRGISHAFKHALLSQDAAVLGPMISRTGALGRDQWLNEITCQHILLQADEIWKSSGPCALAFLDAAPTALTLLTRRDFNHWVTIGRSILETDRSPVALCLAYFQTGPDLIEARAFSFIAPWVEQLLGMASSSVKTALAFCRATPEFVSVDRAFHLRQWAETVRQILETGNGREEAAIACIGSGIRMVQAITFKELKAWAGIGVKIAARDPGVALTYFSDPPKAMTSLYNIEIVKYLQLTSVLADEVPARAMEFYQQGPARLLSLNPRVRERVLDAARDLSDPGPEDIIPVFMDILAALDPLFFPVQETVMDRGLAIGRLSAPASRAYFRSVPSVLSEIPETFLGFWIEKGLACLAGDEQAGVAYFSLRSGESRSELRRWQSAVVLEDHKQALGVFAHALSGRRLLLRQRQDRAPGKGVSRRRYPATDGRTLFLPAFFADEPDRPGNRRLYRLAIAHQAGHIEFGTFGPLFGKIVSLLKAFPRNLLARDIFMTIENSRIDQMLRQEYRGLSADLDQAVAACLARRSFSGGDPLGQALEILLRMTQGRLDETCLDRDMRDWTQGVKKIMHGFFENTPRVWDSFKKTVELYGAFSGLGAEDRYGPMTPLPFQGRLNLDFSAGGRTDENIPAGDGNEADTGEAVHPLTEADIQRLLEKLKEPKFLQDLNDDPVGEGLFITQTEGPAPPDPAEGPEAEGEGHDRLPAVSMPRPAAGGGPFYYDEWDYRQRDYRRRWCTLWERPVSENDLGLFDRIYDNYSPLILKVKKQFQRIRPEVLEMVRQEEWGPEIDFNAMIRSVVDRRTGDAPSDRIFIRMQKRVRRISTVLLVDMSASTDRVVSRVNSPVPPPEGASENSLDRPLIPMDCREKKVIDIEIEGLVVITEALQSLGDEYAIFGFSGYGREQVDFYMIKDFGDPYSGTMKSRICGIRPQKGTRMGPAIRHAVDKLNRVGADLRLLVLLSDGFPQDLNYGEDRSSRDYALHDTMMALAEARRFGIRPFCITVDLAGDDYLRKMWDPGSYLIVNDVYSLPEVLPRVVESLVL